MPIPKYDLIVIGSGPGGEKGAAQAAYFGKQVALIEKESVLGGAAANTGTLPSKTLRETALMISGFRQRNLAGVRVEIQDKVNVQDFLLRERVVKEYERARVAENLKRHKVHLYLGSASFKSAHVIAVKPAGGQETLIEGEIILIATGSRPHRPSLYPFYDSRVYDSDAILALRDIPESMLVVGGGVVGCEYACMFAALGVKVTLVEANARLLGFLDAEVSETLSTQMQSNGITLRMPDRVASVELADEAITVTLASDLVVTAHTILVCSGRTGNTDALGLDCIGLQPTDRGHIEVSEHYQTAVANVYAVGDVIGFPALASTSMEQARVAMVHAFDLKYKTELASILPYGIYTIPECSAVGETEASLTAKGIDYVVGKAGYYQNARGQIIGDSHGFLKLLFRSDDMKLVGVHIIGEQATELAHIGLSALVLGAGADVFIYTCYNYPTLGELYKYATYDALGRRKKSADCQPT